MGSIKKQSKPRPNIDGFSYKATRMVKLFACHPFLVSSWILRKKQHMEILTSVRPIYFIDPIISAVRNRAKKLWPQWMPVPLSAALLLARKTGQGTRGSRTACTLSLRWRRAPCSPTLFGCTAHPGCGSQAAWHGTASSQRGPALGG